MNFLLKAGPESILLNLTDQWLPLGVSILQPRLDLTIVAGELHLWSCEFPLESGSHWHVEWGFGIRSTSRSWILSLGIWVLNLLNTSFSVKCNFLDAHFIQLW